MFQCDICAYFIEQRTLIHGKNADNAYLISSSVILSHSLLEVFINVSTKNSNSHTYFVENGNKILTAILEIIGHSFSTDSQMCPMTAHKISGLSAYRSVSFS
jgi:hypothetical protein